MAEQIGVIENILRNGKRMWGGGWENCKDGGKTYNKGKTEMLDKISKAIDTVDMISSIIDTIK